MKDDRFLALIDAEVISPNAQRMRGRDRSLVTYEGGSATTVAELNEMKEQAYIGQVGGSRSRRKSSRRSRRRRTYRRRR